MRKATDKSRQNAVLWKSSSKIQWNFCYSSFRETVAGTGIKSFCSVRVLNSRVFAYLEEASWRKKRIYKLSSFACFSYHIQEPLRHQMVSFLLISMSAPCAIIWSFRCSIQQPNKILLCPSFKLSPFKFLPAFRGTFNTSFNHWNHILKVRLVCCLVSGWKKCKRL